MASIEKRGENSYRLIVELGYDSKGKRIRKRKTVKVEQKLTPKKLREHLEMELMKFRMEVEAGEYIAPEKMKLKDFVKEWEQKYAIDALSEQTLDIYIRHIHNHILPEFGHLRLDQVKPIHIVNFLGTMKQRKYRGKNLSMATIEYVYRVLRNIFERAKEWQIINNNPVANVKRPKGTTQSDKRVYDEVEVEKLFNAVQIEPLHWQMFTSLALAAGLRRGELLGLEWSKVDFKKGTLQIDQTIGRGKQGRPILKEPKSKTSKRVVSLPPSVVEELKNYYLHWRKEKLKAGERWIENKHQFLFCNEDGTHFYPTTPTTWWRRFTQRVGIRYIRLHDLRHTSATLLINQGVHAKIISKRLGHADIRITMDTYGHPLQAADHEAANKLDDLFSNKKSV